VCYVTKIIRRHADVSQRFIFTSFHFGNIFGKKIPCVQHAVHPANALHLDLRSICRIVRDETF